VWTVHVAGPETFQESTRKASFYASDCRAVTGEGVFSGDHRTTGDVKWRATGLNCLIRGKLLPRGRAFRGERRAAIEQVVSTLRTEVNRFGAGIGSFGSVCAVLA